MRHIDNEQIAFAFFNLCHLIAKLDYQVVLLLHKLLASDPDLAVAINLAGVGIKTSNDRSFNIRLDSVARHGEGARDDLLFEVTLLGVVAHCEFEHVFLSAGSFKDVQTESDL